MATTETEIERRVEELLKRPYREVITGDAEQGFLAAAPELPYCFTAGETEEEALEMLRDAMAGWFASKLEDGVPIPEPEDGDASGYGGRVLVLNQWALTLLARGAGQEGRPHQDRGHTYVSRDKTGRFVADRVRSSGQREGESGGKRGGEHTSRPQVYGEE